MSDYGKSAISFSAIVGDEGIWGKARKYIHGSSGILPLLDEFLPEGKYGEELKLILIMLYIEGKHSWFTMPEKPTLGRFSKKEKSFRYDVPITDTNFFQLPEEGRKEFLLTQVQNAIQESKVRLTKAGVTVDFDTMIEDFHKLAAAYRALPAASDEPA